MATIKLPTSTEVEITQPMAFLAFNLTNHAYLIMPDGEIRLTSKKVPFNSAHVSDNLYPHPQMLNEPITEARFYEMVAENYHTHLAAMQATAKAWGLTIQPLEVS